MGVIWAEMDDAEGYEVSNDGRVRHVRRVKEKTILSGGVVRIHTDGRILKRKVERLVERYHG